MRLGKQKLLVQFAVLVFPPVALYFCMHSESSLSHGSDALFASLPYVVGWDSHPTKLGFAFENQVDDSNSDLNRLFASSVNPQPTNVSLQSEERNLIRMPFCKNTLAMFHQKLVSFVGQDGTQPTTSDATDTVTEPPGGSSSPNPLTSESVPSSDSPSLHSTTLPSNAPGCSVTIGSSALLLFAIALL